MFLGNRLRELRTNKGLTQQKLGELINVTKTSICYFEKNERCPNIDTLSDLCDIFEVSADYFLGRDIIAVSEEENPYTVSLSKEDLIFLKFIKQNEKLYTQIIKEPKRIAELVNLKMK